MVTEWHLFFMNIALQEAYKAREIGEVPIGAVVVIENKIIAKAHNQVELLKDCTAHAEMLALTTAMANLGAKYLPEATLYVTIEPCMMCCGAIKWAQIKQLVFGAKDPKNGFLTSINRTDKPSVLHPKTSVIGGIAAEETLNLLKIFFKPRR